MLTLSTHRASNQATWLRKVDFFSESSPNSDAEERELFTILAIQILFKLQSSHKVFLKASLLCFRKEVCYGIVLVVTGMHSLVLKTLVFLYCRKNCARDIIKVEAIRCGADSAHWFAF